ncbi:MAG: nuclear transport factor 2 family protein [Candidatus Eremiobacteraeota bacterium]|nr:nuclear transport factor 2 family protein [Candidatus Eremiobacteraeota bacterium]
MPSPIAAWHRAVAENDLRDVEEMLAEDAVFFSPAVHSPQAGKALVAKYLRAAMVVLNNPTFRYTGEWAGERSAVLEFEVTIDGIYVDGIDMIHWDERGRIVLFKVMVRPLKGLETVIRLMGRELQPAR